MRVQSGVLVSTPTKKENMKRDRRGGKQEGNGRTVLQGSIAKEEEKIINTK